MSQQNIALFMRRRSARHMVHDGPEGSGVRRARRKRWKSAMFCSRRRSRRVRTGIEMGDVPSLGSIYADADRAAEVAAPRTWLLSKGWRRIGLVDPAEFRADDVDSPSHGPSVRSARARLAQSERLHTLPSTGIGGPRARRPRLVCVTAV